MTDGISIEKMVDGIANTVNETYRATWEQHHPVKAAALREFNRLRRSAMLGAEIACLDRARKEGWAVPMDVRYHAFALAMRLPDGRVGLACNSKERTLAPPREMGDPIREHLMRVATVFDVGQRPKGLPRLPASCRRTLEADGLSADGVETLAATMGTLHLKVGRRLHKAGIGPEYRYGKECEAAAKAGEPVPIDFSRCRWGDIDMTLSRNPRIKITGGKLLAAVDLPLTLVDALPGRDASCFTDHPALAGMTVAKATQHARNLVLTLKEDEDHG